MITSAHSQLYNKFRIAQNKGAQAAIRRKILPGYLNQGHWLEVMKDGDLILRKQFSCLIKIT